MNDITPFDFNGAPVRTITDDLGEPWFIAKDVADVLGYRDAANLARMLDDDERGTRPVSTPSGEQEMTIISESGMYSAVLRSKRSEAKAFRKWVTAEVLPQIRKTGAYAIENMSPGEQIVAMGQGMILLEKRQAEQQAEIGMHAAKIERIEAEHAVLLGNMEQYSVKAMAVVRKVSITAQQANKIGRAASQICREEGRPKGDVKDPVYGRIGAYDEDVLDRAFDQVMGAAE